MKILLTGATGYIGKRLLPSLVENGHRVVCCVREKGRFTPSPALRDKIEVVEADFLDPDTLVKIPKDIDAAYYLIHSMTAGSGNFEKLEAKTARNFRDAMIRQNVRHVIYLSGIVNDEQLSEHLQSRLNVERILSEGNYPLTTLRAGIIVGSGSASFEIIRDLVEKLPVMIAPKWLNTRTQPIAIRDVITFLSKVLMNDATFNKSYDIGGPDILTYKEMLIRFAKVRGLKRLIITVPVMTPRLSSYWLYFITSTSYWLAKNLVSSMKTEVVCRPNNLAEKLQIEPIPYEKAIEFAFDKIDQGRVMSSWHDSLISGKLQGDLSQYVRVPTHGCFTDAREIKISDPDAVMKRIWSIGGENGWYYADWLWNLRGFLDKTAGGVGLRRGRKNSTDIDPGDALDFWRVLLADRDEKRLLLFAEMKLPGEAWLEFSIEEGNILRQTATFRPRGVLGRLYWYSVLPLHGYVFNGMIREIGKVQD